MLLFFDFNFIVHFSLSALNAFMVVSTPKKLALSSNKKETILSQKTLRVSYSSFVITKFSGIVVSH
jgi:hypothetical protein